MHKPITMTTLFAFLSSSAMFCAISFTSLAIAPPAEGPGFSVAYFDAGTLQGILGQNNCTGIRFYNVKASATATEGTVLAIGIRADGSEINGGLFSKSYQMYSSLSENTAMITRLSTSKAKNACENMHNAGFLSYSASFTDKQLLDMLKVKDCNGIQVIPEMEGSDQSMRCSSVIIDKGIARIVNGTNDTYLCGDPCPVLCGPDHNYINSGLR